MGQLRRTALAWLIQGVLIFAAVGCASTRMTAAQERTWDAFHKCSAFAPSVRLNTIREDGSYRYSYGSEMDHNAMRDCMRRERIDAAKAQFTFRFDPALGAFTPPEPRTLIRFAHLASLEPTGTLTESTVPPATTTFTANQPVIFFLGLHNSEQVLKGRFKWFRPGGALELQQSRALRSAKGTGDWSWYTQVLPARRVQESGTWALEAYLNDQLIGRYEFRVVSR
jgi:hypothetical protein